VIKDRDIELAEADPRKGKWIPYVFFGMFAVIIIVNGALVFYAFDSWRGLSTENAYEKGLAYNQALEADRKRQALAWKSQVVFEKDPVGAQTEASEFTGRLILTLKDDQGVLIRGMKIEAQAARPLQVGLEFPLQFSYNSDGTYEAPAVFPLPGQWDVKLRIKAIEGHYIKTERLNLQ